MTEPAQTLRRQIDAYAAGDPADGDYGPTFERKDVAGEAIAALHAVLDLHAPVDNGTGQLCSGCATHVTFTWWPCATVNAIQGALS